MQGLFTDEETDREIREYLALYAGTGPESVDAGIEELKLLIQEMLKKIVFSGELRARLEVFSMLVCELQGEGRLIENRYEALQEHFISEIRKIDMEEGI